MSSPELFFGRICCSDVNFQDEDFAFIPHLPSHSNKTDFKILNINITHSGISRI